MALSETPVLRFSVIVGLPEPRESRVCVCVCVHRIHILVQSHSKGTASAFLPPPPRL